MRQFRRAAVAIFLQLLFPFFAVAAAPVISSLTPNTGAVGSSIVIAGSNFGTSATNASVTFNGTTATISTISSTSITAKVPTGATTGNVVVKVSGVASNGVLFTVTAAPSISSLTPNTGAIGSSIVIAGSNFGPTQGNGKVTFNGTTGTITSWSASKIVATVPTGATTGNVVVTAAGGVASNGVSFTVTSAPSITSLVPTSGIVGAAVTINGSNFGPTQGNGKVTFNGTTATINSWSATQITTSVPAGATTGSVIVTAAGGVASKGVTFTVIPPPSITSISPTSGVTGTSVTISGSNFGSTQGSSTVTFNGTAGAVTSWSSTKVVATAPTAATTGNVVVTVNTQASNGVNFKVLPHITSDSPTTQPRGTNVTINGSGFGSSQGSSTVTFGGVAASAGTWTTTQIIATVPSGAAIGSDPIVVTVGGSASNSVAFTAVAALAVAASPAPTPNANGWNNTNVTISYTCSGGVTPVQCPATKTVSTEGLNQIITATATDANGNTASASTSVSIDKTAPTITAAVTPAPNAKGVVTAPATVNFTCSDSLSGVASCPAPVQLTTAGLNKSFSGSATDKAGNTANATLTVSVQTAPLAITATAAPQANAAGWNNSNVTVSYACSGGVAPLQCPGSQTVSAEGANQSITASVTDAAGQSASANTTLSIDKTPPTITATVSPVPNGQGVVVAPATITFTCSDTLSGVASCPSPIQASTLGLNESFSGTATDKAGNTASATVTISLEASPLTITPAETPQPNAAGWNNTPVTISYTCSGGVAPLQCPGSQTVSAEGANQSITASVTDAAGQSASANTTLSIDKTPPTITATVSPVPNGQGVVVAPATITFTCSDTLSGVASCPSPIQASTLGLNESFSGTATDKAGNSAAATVTISLEASPLTITPTETPQPNATGWNKTPVTISYTCSGGVAPLQCPGSQTVSTEGVNQISATVTDAAGQTAGTSLTVKVDLTPPTATPVITPAPNAAGWNNTAVTVSFTCSDSVSGVATCASPVQLSTEGANQQVCGTVVDMAGNTANFCVNVNIDETPPLISAAVSPTPNANGIIFGPSATVTFTCSDALSGVATCPPSPQTITTQGLQTISGTVFDVAGNSAAASVQFNLQNFPPLVVQASASPPPNSAGWNNSPVTVSFQCTGGVPPVICPSPQVFSADGANQIATGTANDVVGHTATASLNINLDQTPPLVAITSPTDGSISPSANVAISGLVSDSFSGVAAVSCNGAAAAVSGGTFSCSLQITQGSLGVSILATDLAGNTASTSITTNLQGPKLTITSPAPLDLFNNKSITVTGTIDDPKATITVNGVQTDNNNGTFTAQNVVLREGSNVVTATGTNAGGAAGTASVNVVLDTTPPIVTIDSPSDGAVLTNPQIYVTGMVNDVVPGTVNLAQATVTVNGVSADVTHRSFMADDVLLVPGKNVITAIATDKAGNISQSSITVTLLDAATQQRILMVSGNGQAGPVASSLPQPLTVEVVNAAGQAMPNVPITFNLVKGDGQLNAFPQQGRQITTQTDGNGQASATLQLGTRVGSGNNQVLVTSPGFVGEVMFCSTATAGPPEQIHNIAGEAQKGVVGQPLPEPFVVVVFDVSGNPIAGVPVLFTVEQGGGTLEGNPTVTKTTDSDGRASAVLTLAQEEGISNNVVSVSFDGLKDAPANFVASGVTPRNPTNTTVSGIVLDNGNSPLVNVTASIQGTNLTALTDQSGRFTIANAPVGSIELFIDGSTSTEEEPYPFLEFPLVTVAGQDNHLPGPIFLPELDLDNSKVVGGDEDVTLTMKGVPGVQFTVFAHSATFPDGTHVGRLSVSQVHSDKVPMPPPNATAPKLFWTVQPPRVKFNPPIRIQIPNMDALTAGTVTEIFCYNHDLEEFASGGTARVSEDGSVIVSDPGSGVIVSGWGGSPPPPPPPKTCVDGCDDHNDCTTDSCQNGACQHKPPDAPQACCDFSEVIPTGEIPAIIDNHVIYDKTSQCCTQDGVVPKNGPIPSNIDPNDCPNRTQVDGYQTAFDGCTNVPNNPTGAPDSSFSDFPNVPNPPARACDVHDQCYQTCSTDPGARAACDRKLLDIASTTCANMAASETIPGPEGTSLQTTCFTFAQIYYLGVRVGAGGAYKEDQQQACKCNCN